MTRVQNKRTSLFFEFLNQVTFIKDYDFYNDETKRDFNKFMILKFLSMTPETVPYANYCQRYTQVLDDRQMYVLLCDTIPKKKRFIKYIGKKTPAVSDSIQYIAKKFSCSVKEASGYADVMGDS